jgi:hypothetical protein
VSFIIHARYCSIAGMNSAFIQLSNVLDLMDQVGEDGNPVRFQIRFVTADRTRRTGGEIIEIIDGMKCSPGKRDGAPVLDTRLPGKPTERSAHDPNHWRNSTRNILLPNGGIRKVHIRLIIEFNNQKVYF